MKNHSMISHISNHFQLVFYSYIIYFFLVLKMLTQSTDIERALDIEIIAPTDTK